MIHPNVNRSITRGIKKDTEEIKQTAEQTLLNTNHLKDGHAKIIGGIEKIHNSMPHAANSSCGDRQSPESNEREARN